MEIIRTLGFYQPFGSLMLHDKIETRWVRDGRKPPFPLGKYLFYTTQKPTEKETLFEWSGKDFITKTFDTTLHDEPTINLFGYAIGIGTLTKIEYLKKEEENKAFVKYAGTKIEVVLAKDGSVQNIIKRQWGLHFENVQRIEPFVWKFGKQGIGFVPESEYEKIKIKI